MLCAVHESINPCETLAPGRLKQNNGPEATQFPLPSPLIRNVSREMSKVLSKSNAGLLSCELASHACENAIHARLC